MGLYGTGTEFFWYCTFPLLPGDNGPYTESPLDFLATEVEDIGQDIVFLPSAVEEEFSISEVMAKGGEDLLHAQTATPVKQGPVEAQSPALGRDQVVPLVEDLPPSATPSSQTFKHSSTVDTVELMEQVSYPESYQPVPEENLHIDHEESHVLPTSSFQETAAEEFVASLTVPPTTDGTTLATAETSGYHPSVTESLFIWGPNATEDDQLFSSSVVPQEGDLPVVQEDHTTPVIPSEPTTEPKLVHSSTSQHVMAQAEGGDSSGTDEDTSALTVFTHNEEPGIHSTALAQTVHHSLNPEDSGDKGEDRDTESSTTESVDGEEQSPSIEKLVPTAADPSAVGK